MMEVVYENRFALRQQIPESAGVLWCFWNCLLV